MKKILSYMLLIVIVLSSFMPVSAEERFNVYVNGKLLNQTAISVNGRTLVPVRAICEALNCTVKWMGDTKKIEIQNDAVIIALQLDNYRMSLIDKFDERNVQVTELDVPPIAYNGSTMVPTRAIAEALFAEVKWNNVYKCVGITMEYDFVGRFKDGLAIVRKNGKYGFINAKREVVIPIIYERVVEQGRGYVIVVKDGKNVRINTSTITVSK